MIGSIETVPKLQGLPVSLPRESAVEIEVEEGVLVFRVSKIAQERIENLLEKQKTAKLTDSEETELDRYEEIDDYLSFLNRLTRNLAENQPKELDSVA
jgi:NH3-dependent NAD+ synthetase